MTQDQDRSGEEMEQTNTAEGNVEDSAPSASEEGAHGDTADARDAHDAHGADDAHDGHDDHGGHGEDEDSASERSTLVPVTWRQLIFPALILLFVAILLIGPISAAFAPKPATATNTNTEQQVTGTTEPTAAATSASGSTQPTATVALSAPTATTAAENTPTSAPPIATTAAANGISPESVATRTAVAVLGEEGKVSRAPVQLQFAGAQFVVDMGNGTLPDWKPSGDASHAVWIEGTYANHIIYLPYSDANAALFTQAKPGDTVKLVMDNGQTFEFQVTRSERASNGPPTTNGQFTVTAAMSQDHAGVTIILVGDPATDRAVVQADFTGNIQ